MSDVATVLIAAIGAIPPSLLALAAYTEAKRGRSESASQHLDTKATLQEHMEQVDKIETANEARREAAR